MSSSLDLDAAAYIHPSAQIYGRVAMREGLGATDDYLDHWRRAAPVPCGDDLDAEADRAAQDLEATYSDAVLKGLSEAGGKG